jgi:hypothetical protein
MNINNDNNIPKMKYSCEKAALIGKLRDENTKMTLENWKKYKNTGVYSPLDKKDQEISDNNVNQIIILSRQLNKDYKCTEECSRDYQQAIKDAMLKTGGFIINDRNSHLIKYV